jgi:hypothetical protein
MDPNNIRCRWQDHVETGECRFDCFDPVIDISSVCEQIARSAVLADMAVQLYGEPAHLFKDKLIFKPAGAKGYQMHQDYISWEGFPESFLTVIVAIDPSDAASGATEVFPGYHQQGYLSPRDGMYHHLEEEKVDLSQGVTLDLQPGDVAFCFISASMLSVMAEISAQRTTTFFTSGCKSAMRSTARRRLISADPA